MAINYNVSVGDSPGIAFIKATKANAAFANGPCRGLWVGTAGTANLLDGQGEIRADVPLKAGLFPCVVQQVRTGGTADDIWLIY